MRALSPRRSSSERSSPKALHAHRSTLAHAVWTVSTTSGIASRTCSAEVFFWAKPRDNKKDRKEATHATPQKVKVSTVH
jgi:hypothetical protein